MDAALVHGKCPPIHGWEYSSVRVQQMFSWHLHPILAVTLVIHLISLAYYQSPQSLARSLAVLVR